MASGIEVRGLVREFDQGRRIVRAVDDVSLSVEPGEVFGLLGPNGAGKTTTIRILVTTLLPTSGRVAVAGHDVVTETRAVRCRIGFVLGGERGLYDRLTVRDNLRYFSDLYGVDGRTQRTRIGELLEMVDLTNRAGDRVETLSRGMKQRLHIARGLVHDPPVVVLDEPTNGLDPVAARALRNLVRQLSATGRTVLLTTHHMSEADELCQRLAIVVDGRKVVEGSPDEVKAAGPHHQVTTIEVFGADDTTIGGLRALPGVVSLDVEVDGSAQLVHLRTAVGRDVTAVAVLRLGDVRIGRISTSGPNLEDAYIAFASVRR